MENQNGRMYFRSDPVKYCHHPTSEEKSLATEHCAHTRSSAPTCIKQGQPPPHRRRTHALRVRRGCVAWWCTAQQRGAAEARAGGSNRGRVAVAHQSLKQFRSKDPLLYYSPSRASNHPTLDFSSNWSKLMRPFWSNREKRPSNI